MRDARFSFSAEPDATFHRSGRPYRRADNITGRSYLERGSPVTVLVRWSGRGPRNVLIQRGDGSRVVRPFRGLRVQRRSDG